MTERSLAHRYWTALLGSAPHTRETPGPAADVEHNLWARYRASLLGVTPPARHSLVGAAENIQSFHHQKLSAVDVKAAKPVICKSSKPEFERASWRGPIAAALSVIVIVCSVFVASELISSAPGSVSIRTAPKAVITDAGMSAAAFSPDGQLFAVGDAHSVKLWAAGGRKVVAVFPAPGTVPGISSDALAFSPDGRFLAVGGPNGKVFLWNVAKRSLVRAPALARPGNVGVWGLAFSPNGRFLAVATPGRAYLWNISEQKRATLPSPGPDGTNGVIAFSPDGQLLAIGGYNSDAYLWNIAQRKRVATFVGPDYNEVGALTFSSNSRFLVVGYDNNVTDLWDLSRQDSIATFPGPRHGGGASAVTFSPDGRTLAVGYLGGEIRLWNMVGPKLTVILRYPNRDKAPELAGMRFSSSGKALAVGYLQHGIYLWNTSRLAGTRLPA